MRKVKARHYALALCEALKEAKTAAEKAQRISNFVRILAKDRVLGLGQDIIKEVDRFFKQEEGIFEVGLESARPPEQAEKEQWSRWLIMKAGETLPPGVKRIIFKEKIEPALIGGVRLVTNDFLLDASVRGQLDQLKTHLARASAGPEI